MRSFFFHSLAVALLATGCGATTNPSGGSADAGEDTAVDVAGTDAVDDTGTDAIAGNDIPLVDILPDAADAGATDAIAGTDVAVAELPPADVAPDVPNNGCCQTNSECPKDKICIPGKECVPAPTTGTCWSDSDCKSGKCENAFVCPCTADCSTAWSIGKCSDNLGSCCGADKGNCLSDEVCIGNQVCKPNAMPPGSCWSNSDCKAGTCEGASVCPCGAMCIVADKMGTCVDNVKPGGCCANGALCASGETCAHGPDVCKSQAQLGKNQCWADSDCVGGTCSGVNACPCGAMCLIADKPGTCTTNPATCTTVDPLSFGLCDMVIGVVFDGKSCVMASGCGCGKQCAAVFTDLASCQNACGI